MPTYRQQKVFDNLAENGGVLGKAMVSAGYSKNTALTPTKLTNSKGWKELCEKKLPDKVLLKKHKDLLDSKKEEIAIKALDMGYKLKGYYDQGLDDDPAKKNINQLFLIQQNITQLLKSEVNKEQNDSQEPGETNMQDMLSKE